MLLNTSFPFVPSATLSLYHDAFCIPVLWKIIQNMTILPDNLPPLRDIIRTHDLNAKKKLGQNFLLDLNLTRKIASLGGSLKGQTVLEIGPGPGGLTRALLLEGAQKVIAIEKDPRCIPILADIAAAYPDRLEVIEGDAMTLNPANFSDVRIIANLPYCVATPLLVSWIKAEPWPPFYRSMSLMFQKEVAQRIIAKPGSKTYGRLSVLVQYRTVPDIALNLPPEAFMPPPKVESSVVTFQPIQAPEQHCDIHILERVTTAAFGQRRKMLRASLKQISEQPIALLEAANIDPTTRAEQVDVAGFVRLAQLLA